mgnify:CR=1 FL=1
MRCAIVLKPNKPEYYIELGDQKMALGETTSAAECFEKALKLDGANIPALLGKLHANIVGGVLDDVEQQFDLLSDMNRIETFPVSLLVFIFDDFKYLSNLFFLKYLQEIRLYEISLQKEAK